MITSLVHCFLLMTTVVGEFKLQVLHMNDLHSRFEEISDGGGECKSGENCYGGFPRLHTALKTSKQEGVHTIVLNAGDNFQGTPYYSVYKWRIVAAFFNLLKIDAMIQNALVWKEREHSVRHAVLEVTRIGPLDCSTRAFIIIASNYTMEMAHLFLTIGNHEFDNGIEGLVPFIQNVSTPVVVCNLNLTAEPRLQLDNLTPSVVLNFNGTKVGIIGYLTPDTKNLAIVKDNLILDEIPNLILEAKRLKDKNVSIIIALGHSGITMDEKIAAEVEDVDLVVGGHSHTFLYTGEPPNTDVPLDKYPVVVTQDTGKQVPIVHASAYSKYLGNISLTFNDDGNLKSFKGNPILLDSSIPQDKEMLAYLETWSKNLQFLKEEIVGKSWVMLDGNCTGKECNLGNLVTDAMVYSNAKSNTLKSGNWTDASIAVLQGGGIRATLDYSRTRDNITMSDLMTAFPFENTVERTQVTGQILLEMLEWSVAAFSSMRLDTTKAFLQVSGLQVTYDTRLPPFHRVVSVLVRCTNCSIPSYSPLDKDKSYSILTSSFLLFGGDGYSMLRDNHTASVSIGGNLCEILSAYIRDVGVVYPEVSGRVRFREDTLYSRSSLSPSVSPLLVLLIFLFCLKTTIV